MDCKGCGNIKQMKNKNKIGYSLNLEHEYCFFCFQILHYNKDLRPQNYQIIIDNNFNQDSILFLVTTIENLLFDIKLIKKYKYLNLIINKSDKYLRIWNKDKILNFINWILKKENINIKNIFIISCYKNNNIDSLQDYILKNNQKIKYLIGNVNMGKSSIAHKISKISNIQIKNLISKYSNTTQKSLFIPELNLYDTPGIKHNIYNTNINNTIFNHYEWKQFVYQNKDIKTINIDNLFIINMVSENTISSIILYINKNIKLNKINFEKWKMKNDIKYYNNHKDVYNNEIWIIVENLGFIRLKSLKSYEISFFIKKEFNYKIIKGDIWNKK